MPRPVVMPKLGQSEEEGTLVRWLKKEGDAVAKGDVLFEIETDKALLEVESFFDGTLLKIVVPEGDTVPVQSTVAFIGDPGEATPEITVPAAKPGKGEGPRASAKVLEQPPIAAAGGEAQARVERSIAREREARPQERPSPPPASAKVPSMFKISPRAARLAKECAVDPKAIVGTGPGGRIVEKDVRSYLDTKGYTRLRVTPTAKKLARKEGIDLFSLQPSDDGGRITVVDVETALAERPKPMGRMRRVIAQRLALDSFRNELKSKRVSYTITDFILRAVAVTLEEFPAVNSTTDGEKIWWHSRIDLGLAVALEQGLVVPVLRNANKLTLADIHEQATKLTARARAGKLTPDEMTGSTFTISNMGMLDVENFTAIINPGESAILAVSSLMKHPVVRDDRVVIRSLMKMTLSSDHRIIDGALAARFLNAVRNKLEEISLWRRLV
jgi:pyruvate dehydrogenase E2 component (dihydrolipoamide acetyltransferase)